LLLLLIFKKLHFIYPINQKIIPVFGGTKVQGIKEQKITNVCDEGVTNFCDGGVTNIGDGGVTNIGDGGSPIFVMEGL